MTKVLRIYLKACLFLMPIFFLPVVVDSYGFGKNWLWWLMMLLGLIFWVVSMIIKKDNRIVVSKAFNWMLLLTIWATAFWLFGEAGVKVRTFMGVPGLAMLYSLLIWVFLWTQVKDENEDKSEKLLTIAGLITAVSSLVVFLIPTSKMPISIPKENPILSLTSDWSITGSILGELWLLGILAVIWVKKLLAKIKSRGGYVVEMVISAVLVLVLFLDAFKMFKNGWNYLDINSSWVIATESLKYKPLQGVGVGNFLEAFNWWRPSSFNASKNWSSSFGWSANTALQLWTELGIVGLMMGVFTWLALIKGQINKKNRLLVIVGGILVALTPINLLALLLLTWLVVNGLETKEIKLTLKVGENGFNAAPIMFGVVVGLGTLFGLFWWAKVLLGEIYLRKSLVAATANDGSGTYNWQIKAITANGNNAEYRRIYSQTNLVLATGLMSDKNISDEQKEKAATLVQQAVREGKAAVALDTRNSTYWSNLASIYRQLVGSVDGAADWSYQAYAQALSLDAANPSLRLDFGGLLFAAGNYSEAERMFEQVVTLKSDLANGWYNWAHAAKEQNKLYEAVNRLAQAVSLVPATSGDYETANKELDTWKKEYEALVKKQNEAAQQQTKAAETLKVPSALPSGTQSNVEVPSTGLEPPAVPTTAPEQTSSNNETSPQN